jgi:hypothetical protein
MEHELHDLALVQLQRLAGCCRGRGRGRSGARAGAAGEGRLREGGEEEQVEEPAEARRAAWRAAAWRSSSAGSRASAAAHLFHTGDNIELRPTLASIARCTASSLGVHALQHLPQAKVPIKGTKTFVSLHDGGLLSL